MALVLAINDKKDNLFEVGYLVVNKLYYFELKKQEVKDFIKCNETLKIITNNTSEFKFENAQDYQFNDDELRVVYHYHKIKRDYIFIKVDDEINFYYFKDNQISFIKRANIFNVSVLNTNNHFDPLNLKARYLELNKMYDSLLENQEFNLQNIYNNYLKGDLISKILFNIFKRYLESLIVRDSNKWGINDFVISTGFNGIIKDEFKIIGTDNRDINITIDRINIRDNVRTLLLMEKRNDKIYTWKLFKQTR